MVRCVMRVDIFLNNQARSTDARKIEQELRRALFRCELNFLSPASAAEMQELIHSSGGSADYVVLCGGDGTLNVALKPLMKLRQEGRRLPPVCLIPLGTANDFASELKISRNASRAARAIIEGSVRDIDVIEIESDGRLAHMITNGGVGVAAETASSANHLKKWVKIQSKAADAPAYLRPVLRLTQQAIHRIDKSIYELMLLQEMARWDRGNWEVEIDVPGEETIRTRSSFIMVNNQPSIAGTFTPAPHTSNTDGLFNLMVISPTSLLPQAKAILDIRLGKIPSQKVCPSFDVTELTMRATEGSRSLTFFGDGEILHKRVRELKVRCVHPGIPMVHMEAECLV